MEKLYTSKTFSKWLVGECMLFLVCVYYLVCVYLFISMFEEKQTRRPRCLILTTSWSFAPPRRAFFMVIMYYQYILFFMGRQ